MLPAVFEELDIACTFFPIFFFSLSFSIGKELALAKSLPPPGFYGPVLLCSFHLSYANHKNNLFF